MIVQDGLESWGRGSGLGQVILQPNSTRVPWSLCWSKGSDPVNPTREPFAKAELLILLAHCPRALIMVTRLAS